MSEVVIEKDGKEILIEKNIIINQITGGGDQVQSDWNQSLIAAVDYIKNKPVIPAAQLQADWNQSLITAVDLIKNKPVIPLSLVELNDDADHRTVTDDEKTAWNGKYINGNNLLISGTNTIMFDGDNEIFRNGDGALIFSSSASSFTGSISASNLSGTNTGDQDLSNLVIKEAGKGLSSNDFKNDDKNKLDGIESGAQVNVVPTWNSVTDKPETFPPADHNHAGMVVSSTITSIVTLTQTTYDAIPIKDPNVMYVITGV